MNFALASNSGAVIKGRACAVQPKDLLERSADRGSREDSPFPILNF